MKNRELFLNDPLSFSIPNDGVTTIGNPKTDKEWEVVRYELKSCVCEGEYQRGLVSILSNFVSNLDQPKQPAVWVSGFYGSGKSHLVRVLEYLWRDVEFPDGVRARSLVNLPPEIKELLRELNTAGQRMGGLWSAAGTLSASAAGSVRLALLSIAFRSAGLPDDYAQAKFVLWLRQMGYYPQVKQYVETQGASLADELSNLYVSPLIADGLLLAYPGFADKASEARGLIKAQFPRKNDISDDEMLVTLENVLELQQSNAGRLPLTLLVFDELQQFIGDDQDRTTQVQEVVQACTSRFQSRLLFIGTGQSALQSNPLLSKLQARFTVKVTLEDSDVERVVRQVVLRKNPSELPKLQATLDSVRGEIDRHLVGSLIGPISQDAEVLGPDYPLLPTRRRFWERVLKAIDTAGTSAQLRTQLRMVHESNRMVANLELGTVVPADLIYEQQATSMRQSGVLQRDMEAMIQQMDDGTPDGKLRARLCRMIFLIGKLPTEGPNATGLKASAETLADLMVDDLKTGSTALRQRIPALLLGLVERGTLLQIDFEYRLQTRESADWDEEFRRRLAAARADEARMASERSEILKKAVTDALRAISLVQGSSRVARKYRVEYGPELPRVDGESIPVWLQDEWATSEKTLREAAQNAGTDSPLVFALIPRREADELRENLAASLAAGDTLDARPNPTTAEGFEARRSMDYRKLTAEGRLKTLVSGLLNRAKVLQGGGSEVSEVDFATSIKAALEASQVRLFPNFSLADHANWGRVVERAREGAADALRSVNYDGNVDQHPVCREALTYIGAAGKKGSEIRKRFMGQGYGWPQDAVDGALFVLLGAQIISAEQGGQARDARSLDRTQINTANFRRELLVISAAQKIQLRGLLNDVGVPYTNNEEGASIPALLQLLVDLAAQAGGNPPQPERPSQAFLDELRAQSGNEQYAAVVEARAGLKENFTVWTTARRLAQERMPRWQTLLRLQEQAASLPLAGETAPQIQAILRDRALINQPDPVTPLISRLSDVLRVAAREAFVRYNERYGQEMQALQVSPAWEKLNEAQRQQVLFANNLAARQSSPQVGNDEQLLHSLTAMPLSAWESQYTAIPARFEAARVQLAQLLEPQAVRVTLPHRTIKNETDMRQFLNELESTIKQHLDEGNPVIL